MDWSTYREVERQASRLAEMIERLGVDRSKLVREETGAAYAEARGKCLNCQNVRDCLSWLQAWQSEGDAPRFCPNAPLLEACRPSHPDRQS